MPDNIFGPDVRGVTSRPTRGARGAADTWFKDCVGGDPMTGTAVEQDFYNDLIANLRSLVSNSGASTVAGVKTYTDNMIALASRLGPLNVVDAPGGSSDALTATLLPAEREYRKGLLLMVKQGNAANAGPMTINVDTLGAKNLVSRVGSAMLPGDVPANSSFICYYDGARFVMLSPTVGEIEARLALLPIHAEVSATNGRFTVSGSTGSVVITGANVLWRGSKVIDTSQIPLVDRTFATSASKIYHLRWDAPGTGTATPVANYPYGRFRLIDTTDGTYNPSSLAESNVAFDTTFDSLLCAGVSTNGSNNPTITALSNRTRLATGQVYVTPSLSNLSPNFQMTATGILTINWGRAPSMWEWDGSIVHSGGTDLEYANQRSSPSGNRYTLAAVIACNWNESMSTPGSFVGSVDFNAVAY